MRGSSDSRTLVHRAIVMGDLLVARELLRGGARLEARDKRRLCALDEVAANRALPFLCPTFCGIFAAWLVKYMKYTNTPRKYANTVVASRWMPGPR